MLVGISPINKYITNWLKRNGFRCSAILGTDFSFDPINDIITYAFVIPEEHDLMFIELCKKLKPEIVSCDNFILSFFHELGHYMTNDEISDKDNEKYLKLTKKLNKKKDLTKQDYLCYYKSKPELEATRWALDFIVNHPKQIQNFYRKVQKLEFEFLEQNGVKI